MYRAFQTAMVVHKPDVVFVLGEFLIKFDNLNHIVTGVVVLGGTLLSPLFTGYFRVAPFGITIIPEFVKIHHMLIFYFKTVDFEI